MNNFNSDKSSLNSAKKVLNSIPRTINNNVVTQNSPITKKTVDFFNNYKYKIDAVKNSPKTNQLYGVDLNHPYGGLLEKAAYNIRYIGDKGHYEHDLKNYDGFIEDKRDYYLKRRFDGNSNYIRDNINYNRSRGYDFTNPSLYYDNEAKEKYGITDDDLNSDISKLPEKKRIAVSNYYKDKIKEWDKYNVTPIEFANGSKVENHTEPRSKLDRIIGMIYYGGIVEGLYNVTDTDKSTTFGQGLKTGFSYMNPFKNDVQRHTFSDVLRNLNAFQSHNTYQGNTSSLVWDSPNANKKVYKVDDNYYTTQNEETFWIEGVGFIGDVLLDPLTYLDGLGAVSKIIKGTGLTLKETKKLNEALRTTERASKLDDVLDVSYDDVGRYVDQYYGHRSAADRDLITHDLYNRYNEKVLGVRSLDSIEKERGFGIGLPLTTGIRKNGKGIFKEFVSAEALRKFGDKTIAPAFNSALRTVRRSKPGKAFSENNKLLRMADFEGKQTALANFIFADMRKGYRKGQEILDVKDKAMAIAKFFKDNPDFSQADFIRFHESGLVDKMLKTYDTKIKAVEKFAKNSLRNDEEKAKYKEYIKVMKKRREETKDLLDEIYEGALSFEKGKPLTNDDIVAENFIQFLDNKITSIESINKDLFSRVLNLLNGEEAAKFATWSIEDSLRLKNTFSDTSGYFNPNEGTITDNVIPSGRINQTRNSDYFNPNEGTITDNVVRKHENEVEHQMNIFDDLNELTRSNIGAEGQQMSMFDILDNQENNKQQIENILNPPESDFLFDTSKYASKSGEILSPQVISKNDYVTAINKADGSEVTGIVTDKIRGVYEKINDKPSYQKFVIKDGSGIKHVIDADDFVYKLNDKDMLSEQISILDELENFKSSENVTSSEYFVSNYIQKSISLKNTLQNHQSDCLTIFGKLPSEMSKQEREIVCDVFNKLDSFVGESSVPVIDILTSSPELINNNPQLNSCYNLYKKLISNNASDLDSQKALESLEAAFSNLNTYQKIDALNNFLLSCSKVINDEADAILLKYGNSLSFSDGKIYFKDGFNFEPIDIESNLSKQPSVSSAKNISPSEKWFDAAEKESKNSGIDIYVSNPSALTKGGYVLPEKYPIVAVNKKNGDVISGNVTKVKFKEKHTKDKTPSRSYLQVTDYDGEIHILDSDLYDFKERQDASALRQTERESSVKVQTATKQVFDFDSVLDDEINNLEHVFSAFNNNSLHNANVKDAVMYKIKKNEAFAKDGTPIGVYDTFVDIKNNVLDNLEMIFKTHSNSNNWLDYDKTLQEVYRKFENIEKKIKTTSFSDLNLEADLVSIRKYLTDITETFSESAKNIKTAMDSILNRTTPFNLKNADIANDEISRYEQIKNELNSLYPDVDDPNRLRELINTIDERTTITPEVMQNITTFYSKFLEESRANADLFLDFVVKKENEINHLKSLLSNEYFDSNEILGTLQPALQELNKVTDSLAYQKQFYQFIMTNESVNDIDKLITTVRNNNIDKITYERYVEHLNDFERKCGLDGVTDVAMFADNEVAESMNNLFGELGGDLEILFNEQLTAIDIHRLIRESMHDWGLQEVERGLLDRGKFHNMDGRYITHALTKEAREALAEAKFTKQEGKFSPSDIGNKRNFNHKRSNKTMYDPEGNLTGDYITELADIYCYRGVAHTELIYSYSGNNAVKNGICVKHYTKDQLKTMGEDAKAARKYKDRVVACHNDVVNSMNRQFDYLTRHLDERIRLIERKMKQVNDKVFTFDKEEFFKSKVSNVDNLDDYQTKQLNELYEKKYSDKKIEFEGDKEKKLEKLQNELNAIKSERSKYPSDFEEFKMQAFREAGYKDIMVAPNISYFDCSEEQMKILEKYCYKVPGESRSNAAQLYDMSTDSYNIVNKYTKAQMNANKNWLLKLYDTFLGSYRVLNTSINPGFHLQNSVSNAFQSFLGVGSDAFNLNKLRISRSILKTADPKQTVKLNGKEYTYKEMNDIIKAYNVVDNTFFNEEVAAQNFIGSKLGSAIEGTQRVNLFMSFIDKGCSFDEAAEGVNKFLFDYADLTSTEKSLFRRVVPFYTFMRKNIPLMLEQMMEKPYIFSAIEKSKDSLVNISETPYPEKDRNPYRQNDFQIPFDINGQTYSIKDVLPYNQLDIVTSPRKFLSQTTPAFTIPLETATNTYTHFDGAVYSPENEYPAPIQYAEYLGSKIPWVNMFTRSVDKAATKSPTSAALYATGQLIGAPINELTPMVYYPDKGDNFKEYFDSAWLDVIRKNIAIRNGESV